MDKTLTCEITDDTGFLAIFDPDAYVSFVKEDWSYEELETHFKDQMALRRLLIWATGREDTWRIRVQFEMCEVKGFREIIVPIVSADGRLCLTNYENLSMGAQFADIILPQQTDFDLTLSVVPGAYVCRVIQLLDPSDRDLETKRGEVDFIIEIQKEQQPIAPLSIIPWDDILP